MVKALSHQSLPLAYELTTDTGAQSNEFAIDPRTGSVDLLRQLDYEKDERQYRLKVKAVEGRKVPVTSTVNVSDPRGVGWGGYGERQNKKVMV